MYARDMRRDGSQMMQRRDEVDENASESSVIEPSSASEMRC